MLVGVGPARVRSLFERARKEESPSVIFIDEIDAIGKRRSKDGMSNGEQEATLNALLVEMDGMTSNRILVVAATNRMDMLDPALLRAGRFDRHIEIPLPDAKGRSEILRVHAKRFAIDPHVDYDHLGRITVSFSGSMLATMLNEAAWIAGRGRHSDITMDHIVQARDRIAFGKENMARSMAMTDDERKSIAIHEAGHAVIHELLAPYPIDSVTILSRGSALGAMIAYPDRDIVTKTKADLHDEIAILLGGQMAECLILKDVGTGASNDLQRATSIASDIVQKYGMGNQVSTMDRNRQMSDHMLGTVDKEIESILQSERERVVGMLEQHRDWLESIAQSLLAHKTISGVMVKSLRPHPKPHLSTEAIASAS
jgi:cell division protease FtsH